MSDENTTAHAKSPIRHNALSDGDVKAPIHFLTQSYDQISCFRKAVERTNEIGLEIISSDLKTESESGPGPSKSVVRQSLIVDRGLYRRAVGLRVLQQRQLPTLHRITSLDHLTYS